jgi:hypothetical protein
MGRHLSTIGAGVVVAAWGLATAALAEVSGSCSHDGQRVALVDGVAWVEPAEPGDKDEAPRIRLALSTFVIDDGGVARAEDRQEAFRDQAFAKDDSARLELTVSGKVVTQQYLWISPGTNLSYGSGDVGHYSPGAARAGRLSGAYRFAPTDGQDLSCQVAFDVAMLGDVKDAPPLPGVPLPANGGAPGAAYLALNRALHAGDVEAMIRLMPADRAAELRAARDEPEFPRMIAFAQAISPEQVRITGGRQDGDQAWIDFTAVEDGKARVGTAEMKLEAGRWIMIQESTRDPN